MNAKQIAARRAVSYIKEGMLLGLGTGSTAALAIELIGIMVREGFPLTAVASSVQTTKLALDSGIPIVKFSQVNRIDLYIDGADEVDPQLNLVKGAGVPCSAKRSLLSTAPHFW